MRQSISLKKAQSDMCRGHAFGFIGVLVSGVVWVVTALFSVFYSSKTAIWALLIGVTLISPITCTLNKLLKLNGHDANNPLKKLALEGTIWMIICIPLAYGLALQNTEWFFQGMLLIIGGRYLIFQTLFGQKIYWFLGATLAIASIILYQLKIQSLATLLLGSIIEISYGGILYLLYIKKINDELI